MAKHKSNKRELKFPVCVSSRCNINPATDYEQALYPVLPLGGVREYARSYLNLESTLEQYEDELRSILEPYWEQLGDGPEIYLPVDAPRELQDAQIAMGNLILLKEQREAGKYDLAILMGIYLGEWMRRAKVGPFEEDVSTGKPVREGESKGGRARAGTQLEREADEKRWCEAIVKRRRDIPNESRWAACEWVARGEKVGARTIWERVGKKLPK